MLKNIANCAKRSERRGIKWGFHLIRMVSVLTLVGCCAVPTGYTAGGEGAVPQDVGDSLIYPRIQVVLGSQKWREMDAEVLAFMLKQERSERFIILQGGKHYFRIGQLAERAKALVESLSANPGQPELREELAQNLVEAVMCLRRHKLVNPMSEGWAGDADWQRTWGDVFRLGFRMIFSLGVGVAGYAALPETSSLSHAIKEGSLYYTIAGGTSVFARDLIGGWPRRGWKGVAWRVLDGLFFPLSVWGRLIPRGQRRLWFTSFHDLYLSKVFGKQSGGYVRDLLTLDRLMRGNDDGSPSILIAGLSRRGRDFSRKPPSCSELMGGLGRIGDLVDNRIGGNLEFRAQ